jgi:hypothetical protein
VRRGGLDDRLELARIELNERVRRRVLSEGQVLAQARRESRQHRQELGGRKRAEELLMEVLTQLAVSR